MAPSGPTSPAATTPRTPPAYNEAERFNFGFTQDELKDLTEFLLSL